MNALKMLLAAVTILGTFAAHATGKVTFSSGGANAGSKWTVSPGPIYKLGQRGYLLTIGSLEKDRPLDSTIEIELNSYADASALAKDLENGAEIECLARQEANSGRLFCLTLSVYGHTRNRP